MTETEITKIILQIIAIFFGTLIAFSHKKKTVLIITFIYNFLNLVIIFVIKDYSTFYSCILINVRSVTYLFQDKLKKYKISHLVPIGFIFCHIGIGIFSAEHWYQTLTIIAPIIVILSLWYEKKRQHIRLEYAASDTLWLIYNASVGLYLLCIVRTIVIVMNIVAFIKNRNNKTEDIPAIN